MVREVLAGRRQADPGTLDPGHRNRDRPSTQGRMGPLIQGLSTLTALVPILLILAYVQ